jgi:hypothetical protein
MNKNQKIPKLFFCETCDYSTYNNGDFIKHKTTRKHKLMIKSDCLAMLGNEKKSVISSNYNCSYCKFTTHIKCNYDKHLLTEKHKKNVNGEPIEAKYNCSQCTKEYLNYNALWKHKKHCVVIKEREPEPEPEAELLENKFIHSNSPIKELFMEVFKESKELQNVLIEQNKELQNKLLEKENQLLEQNEQHHKEIIELTKKQTTNINTQNNTNNNQFNLQFFLNETCKDAMNIVDFVNSLQLTTDDFETTGKLGFVEGISRIFIKELKKLNTEKLPIHCTDLKRETVYIKDNNIWEKENNEKQKLKWTIDRIAQLNLVQHHNWQEKYPVCIENNTKENEYFFKLAAVALGGKCEDEKDKYREKIMRNVLKEVVLDKQSGKHSIAIHP